MDDQYEPYENFHTRLKVETTYPDGVKDHREGFQQSEYFRNCQREPQNTEVTGFANMNSVVQPPKPKGGIKQVSRKKSASDQKIEDANNKDLKKRNLK